jgi:hypothetical protein
MHYDLSEACMAHTKLETRGVMPIDMRILSWVWWVGLVIHTSMVQYTNATSVRYLLDVREAKHTRDAS